MPSGCTTFPRAKYFPARSFYSVNKCRTFTYHDIFNLEFSDNKLRKFLFRHRIHYIILVLCGAISRPVLVTTLLTGET